MKTFFNVGNGLFVVEEVYGKIFVFDCGGDGIKCAIQRAFIHKNTKIEAVFISHFDRDHINGIHFLLSQCNVKRLVLPLLKDFIFNGSIVNSRSRIYF